MPQLFVPILVNDEIGEARHKSLFSVTGKTMENHRNSEFNGQLYPGLNKKLKECFHTEVFSFDFYEYGKEKEDGAFEYFSENTESISLGILCSAYVAKEARKLKEKYDSITVTGNFNVIDGRIFLSEVTDIEEKYKAVQDYASKNPDKKHLFLYVSSEEIIPDGIQENNVHVIRYDGTFPAECIFAEVFEDTTKEKDATSFQKNRNEFIETRSFIKLKKDFVKNRSCNCCIIKGESNTGKSIAAEALCKYLMNSQLISGYAWFYIGDNGRFIDLLGKERERQTKLDIETDFLKRNNEGNYVKEAYPEVFDTFDRQLQADGRCAIIVDNIEYDIVDDVLSFFDRNYPMGSNKYDLILTSWEGSRASRTAGSINSWTIDISDIALDFKELKAIADGIIRINDYSKRYYESPEDKQNELLELLFQLCNKYTGYIPLVLSWLNKNSIEEVLDICRKEDIKKILTIDKILKITFTQIDFLSKMVLFAYLQIKNFDDALKEKEIINILKKKIFNNASFIDKNDIRISINILQWWYPLLKENDAGHYEIKKAYLNYAVFSKELPNELSAARNLIISPEKKAEYAIEEKRFDEFALYINKITEKETLNKLLIKLCESDSSLEFFQTLIEKGVDLNFICDNETPLQICVRNSADTRIFDFLITKGADWNKCPDGMTLLHCAATSNNCMMLRHILENHYYNNINEPDHSGWTPLHWACILNKNAKSIDLLLKSEAKKDVKTNNGATLLHFAAENKNSTVLRYILDHHYYADINEPNERGFTPLHLACANSKDIKSIEILLEYGADKDARSKDGQTMLHCAAENDDRTVLRYILEHHVFADINEPDDDGYTPLHLACSGSKDIKSIELLLKYGANKDARAKDGHTILHSAAENDDSTVLRYILENHYYAYINEPDENGLTPLHSACKTSRDIKSIELLLEYGASKDVKAINGLSFLDFATANDDSSVLKYILEHHYYTDINEPDDNGCTPLLNACLWGKNTESIELLLKSGADRQARNNRGTTMLHYAAINDDSSVLKYILEHHYYTDINEPDDNGCTPLLNACLWGKNTESIELLLKSGADRQARNNRGTTMLHYAAINDDSSVLKYILEHHYYTDINEPDDNGWTALHNACISNKDTKSIELLLEYGADKQARTNGKLTMLLCASINEDCAVLRYILENHYYNDINDRFGDYGGTALFIAETLESFKLLLEYGADPEIVTTKGDNLLHVAVLNNPEIVEYILKNLPMVNPMLKNSDGKTPADLATSDDIKKLFEKF